MSNKKIAVIGTGYVGLVSAVCFADEGKTVICVDNDKEKIDMLNNGIMPIYEEGLEALCLDNQKRGTISFTTDIEQAVKNCLYIIIAVGTPSMDNGDVDMSAVWAVAKEIGKYINDYKVIINKSTVPVGTQEKVKKIVGEISNFQNYDVVSNPEFLREGTSIYDIRNADRIIIGTDSIKAKELMQDLYSLSDSKLMFTTPKSAEIIKYASNAFLSTKITFINEIANICDIVGADVKEVSAGMGFDKRIAPAFLNAGIGFGGGCFPKDTKALLNTAKEYGYDFKVLKSVIEVNELQKEIVIGKVNAILKEKPSKIAVWGLSFKPGTNDVRGSVGIEIIQKLKKQGHTIIAYDPKALEDAKRILKEEELASNMYDAVKDAHLLLVLTEWKDFANADFTKVKQSLKTPQVLDGRNCLDKEMLLELGFSYVGMGR